VVRGDIHAIAMPRRRGHIQHGRRYAVVVQADDLLTLSTVIVCPTSQSVPEASFHPQIDLNDERTLVLCEMVGAVDAHALGGRAGHLTLDEMHAVDDAMLMVLDLS
jgi:mRNA interferase MazF